MDRHTVFVSYSHRDRKHLDRLRIHLRPLERQGLIDLWADTRLQPGTRWRDEIGDAISRCRVAVLLVSADFLASAFIVENELPPLIKAANANGVTILPVIISPCRFTKTPVISELQAVNDPERPLSLLPIAEREKVWVRVADAVEAALVNRSPTEGWRVVTERRALEYLNELMNSPPESFLIISSGDYYVQFWREEDSILTEAVSNAFLPEKLRLGESKIDKLQGLGLTPPSKDLENFSRIDGTSDPTRLLPRLARAC
jgi:TIR domain/T3SS (YopN, CesT) and YbjN peptide-binding chaperone 3